MHIYASIPLLVHDRPSSHVVIGIPFATAIAPARREMFRNLTSIALLGLIAAAFAVWLSDRLLARRTDRLLQAAGRLEAGDLAARTGLPAAPDEIGHLARAFDQMASSLERAAREQQKEEERWRDLAEAALDGVLVHDGFAILDVNRRLADIFGYEPGELRGAALGLSASEAVEAWLQRECTGVREAVQGARRDGPWLASGPLDPGVRVGAADGIFRVGNAAGEAHPIPLAERAAHRGCEAADAEAALDPNLHCG
jgi:HAMP domain-containing protein